MTNKNGLVGYLHFIWHRICQPLLRFCLILFILGIGLAYLSLGSLGVDYHFGAFWAFVWVFGAGNIAYFLRISWPLSIGAYFGAVDVLGWSWYAGLAFAATSGFFFMLPVATSEIGKAFEKKTLKEPYNH